MRYVMFLASISFLAIVSTAQSAATQQRIGAQTTAVMSDDDYKKADLELRKQTLDVERNKNAADAKVQTADLAMRQSTAILTALPIFGVLVTAIVSVLVARQTLIAQFADTQKTVIAQFAVKAAELALLGEGPGEVINRAKLLAILYEDLLPQDFAARVEALEIKGIGRIVTQPPWGPTLSKEAVELLAQYPRLRTPLRRNRRDLLQALRPTEQHPRATWC